MGGLALTGVLGCLISPVTWVHHLVWIIPALIELAAVGATLQPYDRLRRRRLWYAFAAYLVLSSNVVWIWWKHDTGVIGFLGSNLYVYISLALLFWMPIRAAVPTRSIRDRVPAQIVRVIRRPRVAAEPLSRVDGQPLT
jgi:alpha-1,2-mannosyltransferase